MCTASFYNTLAYVFRLGDKIWGLEFMRLSILNNGYEAGWSGAPTFNSNTQQADLCEFETNLVYIASTRPVKIHGEPLPLLARISTAVTKHRGHKQLS